MGVRYRLSQLWHNVTAQSLSQPELEEITEALNPKETALFQQMSTSDQRHAYHVNRLLKSNGHTDADLLAAALLHDVGKVRVNLTAWDRSMAVIGNIFVPQRAEQWGAGDGAGWKRGFVVREQHAAWGAALAKNADSRPGVVELIMRHQNPVPLNGSEIDEQLKLLQWADDQN